MDVHNYPILENQSDDDDVEEEKDPHGSPEKEILWAAVTGRQDIVNDLITSNPDLVNVKDKDGYTPLHRACYENHTGIAELLLQNRANISALTNEMWQPLHSASRWNCHSCVQLLLDWGADVNALTKGGLTALHLAASNRNACETLVILLNHPAIDASVVSSNGETALEIVKRCGPFSKLFEILDPAINII